MPRVGFVRVPKSLRKYFPDKSGEISLLSRGKKSPQKKRYNSKLGRIFGLKAWFRQHNVKVSDRLILKILEPSEKFYLGIKRQKRALTREGESKLIDNYVENIPRVLLRKFKGQFEGWFKQGRGIYALYKGKNLYYVGMGRIPGRILHHFYDKHKNKWDNFSAYIIRREKYTREFETIISRFARPMGSEAIGKLSKKNNLKRKVKKLIKQREKETKGWWKWVKK